MGTIAVFFVVLILQAKESNSQCESSLGFESWSFTEAMVLN